MLNLNLIKPSVQTYQLQERDGQKNELKTP
jgi:hypothetical protein